MRRQADTPESNTPRSGYTLLELLVVIGLILFMMTVLVMTIGNTIGTAKEQATRATLVKLEGLLQDRLDAFNTVFDKAVKRGEVAAEAGTLRQFLQNNGLPGMPANVCEMLVRKNRLRQAFPQTGNPSAIVPSSVGPDNPRLIGNAVNPGPFYNNNVINEAESSEYLYYMLVESDFFGVAPVDAGEFSTSEVGDTDGDGRLEFLDAWGKPFRFYRWPTRLIRPTGIASAPDQNIARLMIGGIPPNPVSGGDSNPLTLDPDDQLQAYSRMQTRSGSNAATIAANFESMFHTINTYHTPLIVSAGRDGRLGLFEPNRRDAKQGYLATPLDTVPYATMFDWLSDDITSRNVKTR